MHIISSMNYSETLLLTMEETIMYSYEHKVHYYETDQMKVVHHSNYIRWFEECRLDLMQACGLGYEQMEEEEIISPVLSVSCQYHAMTKFGETVEILPKVESFNGIRLKISYTIREKETKQIRCTGESTHCFLDAAGRPVNLKKKSPRFYELYEGMRVQC